MHHPVALCEGVHPVAQPHQREAVRQGALWGSGFDMADEGSVCGGKGEENSRALAEKIRRRFWGKGGENGDMF